MLSDFRSPGCRVVSFMVEWLSSSPSVLEFVEWSPSWSNKRRLLLRDVLGEGTLDRPVTLP